MSRPHHPITLEPLRSQGPDSLNVRDIPEIHHITLREVQVTPDTAFHETITRRADDLFRCAEAEAGNEGVLLIDAPPTQAFFDVHFADSEPPRSVLLRVPNTVKLERDSDAPAIDRWLNARGFTAKEEGLSA
jgi:hypothetical protein